MTWREQDACAETDAELWFDTRGHAPQTAKDICSRCTAAAPCLDEATRIEGDRAWSGRYGIRGGLDPDQRKNLARKARR